MNLPTYYQKNYAACYLDEQSELFEYKYEEGADSFYCLAVKRAISGSPGKYDLETPYGIGGYLVSGGEAFVQRAFNAYKDYCRSQGIVAEFLRFSPFNPFPKAYGHLLDFVHEDRQTVVVDLQPEYESIRAGYADSLKRNIRKAERAGLGFEELPKDPHSIEQFMRLYAGTMDRHQAGSFYYFTAGYFEQLFSLPDVRVFGVRHEGRLINMVVMLFGADGHIYYHLGATDPEFYQLNPNPFVFDRIIRAFRGGYQQLFMGGGLSGDPEDPLFRFKRKFSPAVLPYYIGGAIMDRPEYEALAERRRLQNPDFNPKYFLKYRY